MTNSPTHIFAARMQTLDGVRDVLEQMDRHDAIELDEVYRLIHPDQSYYVIHNIRTENTLDRQSLVQGDSLSIFIQDYIEPVVGDGLDMHVFPEDGSWCLVFDIDGRVVLKTSP